MTRTSLWQILRRRAALFAALAGACVLVSVWVSLKTQVDPGVAWLAGHGDAAWVVYPVPAYTAARAQVELQTTFRTAFRVPAASGPATLSVRAFRRAQVFLNGAVVPLPDNSASWKAAASVDVGPFLRAGDNLVEVVVANADGPPALWAELRAPGVALATGPDWEASIAGAAWRRVQEASSPPPGRRYDPTATIPSAWAALRERAGTLLLLAAIALGAAALARAVAARRSTRLGPEGGGDAWPLRVAFAVVAVFWLALLVNNGARLPLGVGYDASAHLDYVRYIAERHAIPLADEGWQMFQPPLYYLLVAGALGVLGLSVDAAGATLVVRGLGVAFALAHLALVAVLLRRVLSRADAQVAGLIVAAALPALIVMSQLPTNEVLAATLCGAVLVMTVRLLQDDTVRLPHYAGTGALLGLALLAKFSALLLVPPVLGALVLRAAFPAAGTTAAGTTPGGTTAAGTTAATTAAATTAALSNETSSARRRFLGAAVVLGTAFLTCCWHFGRVYARFGDPFVSGWERREGMAWWVDPGYRTAGDFVRFGRALADPVFAGFGGVWDGIYSTVWGDGMLSGAASAWPLPPWWSPSLHSLALLLALVPLALALVGLAASLARFARTRDPVEGLLSGTALLMLAALASMALRVPSVVALKGTYGLLALGPLAVFAGRGLERVAAPGVRRSRGLASGRGLASWRGLALLGALGAWALASFFTFWVDARSGRVQVIAAHHEVLAGRARAAETLLRDAVRLAPGEPRARIALARLLTVMSGHDDEVAQLLDAGRPGPEIAPRYAAIASWAASRRDHATAESAARAAVALDPDFPAGWTALAQVLERTGRGPAAADAYREALRLDPYDRRTHETLAGLLERNGDAQGAALHRAYAERLSSR